MLSFQTVWFVVPNKNGASDIFFLPPITYFFHWCEFLNLIWQTIPQTILNKRHLKTLASKSFLVSEHQNQIKWLGRQVVDYFSFNKVHKILLPREWVLKAEPPLRQYSFLQMNFNPSQLATYWDIITRNPNLFLKKLDWRRWDKTLVSFKGFWTSSNILNTTLII